MTDQNDDGSRWCLGLWQHCWTVLFYLYPPQSGLGTGSPPSTYFFSSSSFFDIKTLKHHHYHQTQNICGQKTTSLPAMMVLCSDTQAPSWLESGLKVGVQLVLVLTNKDVWGRGYTQSYEWRLLQTSSNEWFVVTLYEPLVALIKATHCMPLIFFVHQLWK